MAAWAAIGWLPVQTRFMPATHLSLALSGSLSWFGFPDVLEKLGMNAASIQAEIKIHVDPFRPENPDDVAYLKSLQSDIHEQFIDYAGGGAPA